MPNEAVILIPGHGAPWFLMLPLQRKLRREGYRAEIFSYRSLWGSVTKHADKLRERLDRLDKDPAITKIHCVGHSMGSVVLRTALIEKRPTKMGRMVLLAPPNHGARLADFALKCIGGPTAARELSSDPKSFVNQLPLPKGIETGIVAARYDHAVALASTYLEGQADHVVLDSVHTVQLHPRISDHVIKFLSSGKFPTL